MNYAQRLNQQRRFATETAARTLNNILFVVGGAITIELYARGYGQKGVKRFMDCIMDNIQEFIDLAKGEYIDERGYTKKKNLDYARKRYMDKINECMKGEPIKVDLTELMDLFMKMEV